MPYSDADFGNFFSPTAHGRKEDSMPQEYSVLTLGSSPPSAFMPRPSYDSLAGEDSFEPFACRRVASFPMVNPHSPKPCILKVRSVSESAGLNRKAVADLALEDLKREFQRILKDEQCKAQARASSPKPTTRRSAKKVAFADDRGLDLFTIRIMTEPSDMPPKLPSAILRAAGCGVNGEDTVRPASTWLLDFEQPAGDYMAFRQQLQAESVALENAFIRNDTRRLVGTVKVKNIAFEKEVFIRITDNGWQSYLDKPCHYMPGPPNDLYDTFGFDFDIPMDDDERQRLEFCICFLANGQEFWDSHQASNYCLKSERLRRKEVQSQPNHGQSRTPPGTATDAYMMNYDNWTTFASWTDLKSAGPYY